MAGSSRGNPKLGDIVRTVFVMGAALVLLWFVGQLFTVTPDEPPVPDIDYTQIVPSAEDATGFDVISPESLPEGWKATSARVRDNTWNLGVLTDDEEFIGLVQGEGSHATVVSEHVEKSDKEGATEIGGQVWTKWSGPEGETSYSRVVPGETDSVVVVTSDVDEATLLRYVGSLS